ncbi:MAG TPA: LacI family DNA-binding transcriptional regulator [Nocardioidaceae bacterium]|nr:LacI family DNA-binding transcriptional regulator [Nocardioidaceae bacterium]
MTLTQVAASAGVSTATAARALGGYGSVRPVTRDLVREAAARLGYRANGLARSMITGSTRTIGVVVSDIENAFFSRALRGVSGVARRHGYEVVLVNTDEDAEAERTAVRVLMERRVDGLVVSPGPSAGAGHLHAVRRSGTPLVLLDRRIAGLAADSVGIDNHEAACTATDHLLALGHRRIALVTGSPPGTAAILKSRPGLRGIEKIVGATVGLRAAGYRDALVAQGVDPDLRFVTGEGFHLHEAAAATRQLMALPEPPTAIIALDSVLSLGVLQALDDMQVPSPQTVSVIGFDDADWAEAVSPALTVIAQPAHEIGETAGELLISRIAGSRRRPVHRQLPTTFVGRASTGPAPSGEFAAVR